MEAGKEVTTKQAGAVSTHVAPPINAPHIGSDDLLIPKILPIHYMSDKAKGKDKSAEPGEFRDTVENKLFGGTDQPFEFIPVHMTSFWAEYEVNGDQRKYVGQVPLNAANEKWPREEKREGKLISRMKTYEAFVLIPDEVKAGSAFPYVLSFRSTSLRAGKTLLTQMYVRNIQAKKQPYATACEISLTEESNDKGDFFVSHIKPKRAITESEMKEAQRWQEIIAAGQVKVDNSDLETASGEEAMKDVNTDQF